MTDVNWSEKPAEGGFIIAKKFIAIDCGSSGSVDDFGRDADLTRLPPLHAGGFGVFGDLHVVLKPPPANGCILIRRIQCSCKLLNASFQRIALFKQADFLTRINFFLYGVYCVLYRIKSGFRISSTVICRLRPISIGTYVCFVDMSENCTVINRRMRST